MTDISIYKEYIETILKSSFPDELMINYFGRIPKYRYETFTYALNYLDNLNLDDSLDKQIDKQINITELGTSRSFVDGAHEGCNSDDSKYWEPTNPSKWDWGAGCFTKIFSECITNKNIVLNTVDIEAKHITRCKLMTSNSNNIIYHIASSEDYLNNCKEKSIDLLYLDTGDVVPVEPTAQLHLREAEIIVRNNILKDDGIILIDDVKNLAPKLYGEDSDYGKAKYSIPYFLNNGYYIVIDEYQVILKKNKN